MKTWPAAFAASLLALVGLVAAPAEASPAGPRSCRLDGTVTFRPAVGALPNDIKAVTKATGTCDGQPASWRATNAATVTCALLSGPGVVWLTVGGETAKFTAQTTIASGVGVITFPGKPFVVLAHLQPSGASGVLTDCLTSGASSADIHLQLINTSLN